MRNRFLRLSTTSWIFLKLKPLIFNGRKFHSAFPSLSIGAVKATPTASERWRKAYASTAAIMLDKWLVIRTSSGACFSSPRGVAETERNRAGTWFVPLPKTGIANIRIPQGKFETIPKVWTCLCNLNEHEQTRCEQSASLITVIYSYRTPTSKSVNWETAEKNGSCQLFDLHDNG